MSHRESDDWKDRGLIFDQSEIIMTSFSLYWILICQLSFDQSEARKYHVTDFEKSEFTILIMTSFTL